MRINIHAGHNPDSKVACGAVGIIKESTEARAVKSLLIGYLRQAGHTVYDCTCDNGTSQSDILNKIIAKCNAHTVDLDVSIHFNSGAGDRVGNGKTTGTEVLIYSSASKAADQAKATCAAFAALGFRNRGVKVRSDLAVLRRTNAPAMLVECCFVDDADDAALYRADQAAQAIYTGITGSAPGYPAKVINSVLNVRAGTGTHYAKLGQLHKGDTVRIVETSGTWGRLIDGGWVALKHTKKI